MAHYEDITIDQGADFIVKLKLLNQDGSRKDLTDHSFRAFMKKNYADDSSEAIEFECFINSPASSGIVTMSLTNIQTDSLDYKKKYVYDVELSHDSGGSTIIERVLQGTAQITPSVTR